MAKVSAKNTIILVNGYSLSTYFTAYEGESSAGKISVQGFTDGSENSIPGLPTAHLQGDVLWDKTANTSFPLFRTLPTGHITLIPEGYVLGNNTISLPFMQGNYMVKGNPAGAIELGTINFESYGNNVGIEQGWALHHGIITTTTTGTGFDDPSGGAVTATCSGTLHIWDATTTDTYVVKIQHSTTLGSGYSDLITFVANGTSVTSERIAVASGTINRYRRVLATRTGSAGDTFGFSVHFQHQ